jgi:hypothetical protein
MLKSTWNIVFNLGDITGQDYLNCEQYSATNYPDGYSLLDNSKIIFKWIENGFLTYIHFDATYVMGFHLGQVIWYLLCDSNIQLGGTSFNKRLLT